MFLLFATAEETTNTSILQNAASVGIVFLSVVSLLSGVLVILNIVKAWKSLTAPPPKAPPPPPTLQFVTRGELDSQTTQIKTDLIRVERDLKVEMQALEVRVTAAVEKIYEYTHKSFHDLAEKLNSIALKNEASRAQMFQEFQKMVVDSNKPIIERLERQAVCLVRIEERLKIVCPEDKKD